MPISLIDSAYYQDLFGSASMRALFSDEARFQAWLDTEAALARAQASLGMIPQTAAEEITRQARVANLDLGAMRAEFDKVGFPIVPLVHQLARSCSADTARYVHWGSTTQDITDTGMVLQIRTGLALLDTHLRALETVLCDLAARHRDTVMVGRTMQQQAAPITFGYKVAGWLDELHRDRLRLLACVPRVLVGECAGAVGSLATLGTQGLAVRAAQMRELDLGEPDISWHTARDRWVEVCMGLGLVAGCTGRIANEIVLLMRTEVDELREPFVPGRGASSTLPQKRNPINCQPVIAIARMLRERVGLAMDTLMQDHERGTGPMHLEWGVLPDAFVLTDGAVTQMTSVLEGLMVDTTRMRANLEMTGMIMAESVMMGLAPLLGRGVAHDVVYAACGQAMDAGRGLREVLLEQPEIAGKVDPRTLDDLLDPAGYTGACGQMVDRVLERVRSSAM
ncbi:MAG: adenylosuccinate lyase family protein [Gammaproteobacteria bacterium]|nr:adenylosuccinate lyase family protein [Gammaproteobacteria bacterium]